MARLPGQGRFFTANKYIERMTEAKTRVETAVDIIQKHCIVDTKSEVFKVIDFVVLWGLLRLLILTTPMRPTSATRLITPHNPNNP